MEQIKREEIKDEIYGYNKKTLIFVAVLLLVAGSAFYVGAKYEKNKLFKLGLLNDCKSIAAGKIIEIYGEIVTKNDNTMTIKANDGSIQDIFFTPATRMSKKNKNRIVDLAVGQSVMVKGERDDRGVFSAQVIQLLTDVAPVSK
jgi:hypothetical protein